MLLVSGYFCGMRYYAVVPTYRAEAILFCIFIDFKVCFNFDN